MDPVNSAQDPLEVCFNTEMHLKKKKQNKTKQKRRHTKHYPNAH